MNREVDFSFAEEEIITISLYVIHKAWICSPFLNLQYSFDFVKFVVV